MSFPYPGPIPPETNPPIQPQYYQPSRFVISAIALGSETTVTTTVDQNYVIGQEVRLLIPPAFGCRQLNGVTGFVLSIPSLTQVVVSINSSNNVDPFVSSSYKRQSPQIVAVGDVNSGVINSSGISSTGTYVLGSFINISPA
jgi:ABC-type Fe3+-hydroxamate transport system substrate-binding protein